MIISTSLARLNAFFFFFPDSAFLYVYIVLGREAKKFAAHEESGDSACVNGKGALFALGGWVAV